MKKLDVRKIIIMILLVIAMCISIFSLSPKYSSADFHAETIETLDDKKITAMGLTTAVAVTSTAITAMPDDIATPIAEEISELSTPLLFVVCAIYLEKFLLTTTCYISFSYIIPFACILGIVYELFEKQTYKSLAIKLAIFAIAISMLVPASVKITNLIEETFEQTITETYEKSNAISKEAEESAEKNDTNAFTKFLQTIGNGVTTVVESAKNALSVFVDAVAVMIITVCVIPLAVLFILVWLIKILFGVNITIPSTKNIYKFIGRKLFLENNSDKNEIVVKE